MINIKPLTLISIIICSMFVTAFVTVTISVKDIKAESIKDKVYSIREKVATAKEELAKAKNADLKEILKEDAKEKVEAIIEEIINGRS